MRFSAGNATRFSWSVAVDAGKEPRRCERGECCDLEVFCLSTLSDRALDFVLLRNALDGVEREGGAVLH